MNPYDPTPTGRDPELWRIARRRAKFKAQVVVYLLVNALLWSIWYFTDGGQYTGFGGRHGHGVPWPVWATVFWGLGLAIQGLNAYGAFGHRDLAEREYERLTRDRS